MTDAEQEVLYAAIRWYKEVLRLRDKLSPAETKLFYAVSLLENSQVTKLPDGLYDDRSTTPAPSPLIDELLKRSKKDPDGN